jgi:hypothetical protein
MLATIRTAPPQWMQVFTSMPNTRLRRCAQVTDRRRSAGVRSSVGVEVAQGQRQHRGGVEVCVDADPIGAAGPAPDPHTD